MQGLICPVSAQRARKGGSNPAFAEGGSKLHQTATCLSKRFSKSTHLAILHVGCRFCTLFQPHGLLLVSSKPAGLQPRCLSIGTRTALHALKREAQTPPRYSTPPHLVCVLIRTMQCASSRDCGSTQRV